MPYVLPLQKYSKQRWVPKGPPVLSTKLDFHPCLLQERLLIPTLAAPLLHIHDNLEPLKCVRGRFYIWIQFLPHVLSEEESPSQILVTLGGTPYSLVSLQLVHIRSIFNGNKRDCRKFEVNLILCTTSTLRQCLRRRFISLPSSSLHKGNPPRRLENG